MSTIDSITTAEFSDYFQTRGFTKAEINDLWDELEAAEGADPDNVSVTRTHDGTTYALTFEAGSDGEAAIAITTEDGAR
jgi:hypothetical protein